MIAAHDGLGRRLFEGTADATFSIAMLLVVTGVVLGQTNWQKILGARWLPQE